MSEYRNKIQRTQNNTKLNTYKNRWVSDAKKNRENEERKTSSVFFSAAERRNEIIPAKPPRATSIRLPEFLPHQDNELPFKGLSIWSAQRVASYLSSPSLYDPTDPTRQRSEFFRLMRSTTSDLETVSSAQRESISLSLSPSRVPEEPWNRRGNYRPTKYVIRQDPTFRFFVLFCQVFFRIRMANSELITHDLQCLLRRCSVTRKAA